MAATIKIIVQDKGWNTIKETLTKYKSAYTKVGFPTEKEPASGDQKTMADVSDIATFNEYGTKHIPARPFMSTSFKENKEKIQQLIDVLYDRLLRGTITIPQALGLIGEFTADRIKEKIRAITTPPNKPSTIKRKMRKRTQFLSGTAPTKVLIDTGQMINTVTHVEVFE